MATKLMLQWGNEHMYHMLQYICTGECFTEPGQCNALDELQQWSKPNYYKNRNVLQCFGYMQEKVHDCKKQSPKKCVGVEQEENKESNRCQEKC